MKRFMIFTICLLLLCGMAASPAMAEGEEVAPDTAATTGTDAPETDVTAEDTAAEATPDASASTPDMPAAQMVDDGTDTVDAALCARVLRAGAGTETYEAWLRTLPHVPHVGAVQKVGRAILKYALGMGGRLPSNDALFFVPCTEAPLPGEGVNSYVRQEFNLHGAVYSTSPLTSVTVSVKHRAISGGHYPFEATVRFDASENRMAFGLDEEVTVDEKLVSLNTMMTFDKFKTGKHAITVTATTAAQAEPVALYEANFEVLNEKPVLTSNAFRDNYSTALRFFGGDTSKFLMAYTWRSSGKRDINTDEDWRTNNIVKSSLGRVHVDALSNFEQANGYLESSYVRVSVNGAEGKVLQLAELVDTAGTYVPRFQSDLRLISHHTFGTAIDVNAKYGANLNNAENQALIYAEVHDHLVYNGIQTDEEGKEFYDFTYTGDYSQKASGIPKSVINYLIYELAFYRTGFSWGFYYDHTCDAMHFSLTDGEYYRHMDSETGLRKVFEYCN